MFWHHWMAIGAGLAALGVALGAFGAHSLKGRLSPEELVLFETAVRYHLYHAFALIAVAFVSTRVDSFFTKLAGWGFLTGIVLFCGSLHVLIFVSNSARWVWPLTPLGGLCLIASWSLLAYAALH